MMLKNKFKLSIEEDIVQVTDLFRVLPVIRTTYISTFYNIFLMHFFYLESQINI